MIDRLIEFTEALRRAKVPVSLIEAVDAANSLRFVDLSQRELVRSSLASTLIKDQGHRHVFDVLFDLYFSLGHFKGDILFDSELQNGGVDHQDADLGHSGFVFSDEELRQLIANSLFSQDGEQLAQGVSEAVSRFAGIEPGRPVGGVYYAYRTLRQLNLDAMRSSYFDSRVAQMDSADTLARKVLNHEIEAALDRLRKEVDLEIKRRLVDDRGADAVARTLRVTLPEDIEFMHANSEELDEIGRSLKPLVRKLAARLGRKRRIGLKGPLDFRRTIRHSMAFGGVPAELAFHRPTPTKPEIMVVADISGSVASFARFTLAMVYALSEQFSKVRSFVFIDAIDEVTDIFESSDDIETAMRLVNTKARVVWMDGHSDYGRVLERFIDEWGREITPRTSVIFLGDARNNYHPSRAQLLATVRARAKSIHWLNPEPASYWDTGDSIVSEYGLFCDSVNECRNLRQLQSFVEGLV